MVTKLFAKHIKLKEAIDTVKKTRINIGVGTPQRISDLLDNGKYTKYALSCVTVTSAHANTGALSSSSLERIIIDASHIDQKKRGILDMKETQVPLVQLLTRRELTERYGTGENNVELLFF